MSNMAEQTLELQVPLLLPGVDGADDACLRRLETALENQAGLSRAHVEREKQPPALCVHYDPAAVSVSDVQRLAERAGAKIVDRYHHDRLTVEGMDCSDCVKVIEHGVSRLEGVLAVNVNYASQELRVEFDAHKTDRAAIEKRVRGLGYAVVTTGLRRWIGRYGDVLVSLAAGLAVLLGWLGETFLGLPHLAAVGVYLVASVLGGWHVVQHTWHALRRREFDTDLLMLAAALGAAALGDFAEGALLLFLFSLSHALEERALDRARSAVRALAGLAPKTARVQRAGRVTEIAVDDVLLDDTVLVRPGVRLPVDGAVLVGQSAVDQSPVTGESTPVDKAPGDAVFAGSVNGEGELQVRVTRLARDSTLARVMKLVEEAETQQSPTQLSVDKFMRLFVPGVLIATALVIVVPPLFGVPFSISFLRAMTLLVAASPCALAVGTPAAVLSGIAQAARGGVLIKGGAHLENLGRLRAVAFDKTGTLTRGQPAVTDVLALGPLAQPAVLALAAALENHSAHPLAQAVVRAAQAQSLALPEVAPVESVTGRGLRATYQGQPVQIGSPALLIQSCFSLTDSARQQIDALQSDGKSIMALALAGQLVGLIAVADTLRPEAAGAMRALKQLGVAATVMLTGDNARVAGAIAGQVGLTEFRADLMPEDKLAAIQALNRQYAVTAMVGDGVNDAPALATATVGIAMGGAGTAVALETADVALMGDDLARLPFAVGLGRATRAIILQNLWIALGMITILVVAALTGFTRIGVAVVFHEGSTLLVILNALRLLGYRQPVNT